MEIREEFKKEIKQILYPHLGHLKFLLSLKSENISEKDIKDLIPHIKDKNLIKNLPRNLHQYKTYYFLVKDIASTKTKLEVIRMVKNNLASIPKKIYSSLLQTNNIIYQLYNIIEDKETKELFLRWSSRVKTKRQALNYMTSVIKERNLLKKLTDSQGSNIRELNNFSVDNDFIPHSWCIKNCEQTFKDYLTRHRMFLLPFDGEVYGINLYVTGNIEMISQENNNVYDVDMIMMAKEAMLRYKIFGKDDSGEKLSKFEKLEKKDEVREIGADIVAPGMDLNNN